MPVIPDFVKLLFFTLRVAGSKLQIANSYKCIQHILRRFFLVQFSHNL
jgi:hypothetical protein